MRWEPIGKPDEVRASANMPDYDRVRREFDWATARSQLSGLPGSRGLNIAHEAVDRHAAGERAQVTALRCVDKQDRVTEISYAALRERTNRFANVLGGLGVGRGERVYTLLGRVPALCIAVLGTLKAGCVLSPLFSAFGPQPISDRMRIGEGAVLVTTARLYRNKIRQIRASLPQLRQSLPRCLQRG